MRAALILAGVRHEQVKARWSGPAVRVTITGAHKYGPWVSNYLPTDGRPVYAWADAVAETLRRVQQQDDAARREFEARRKDWDHPREFAGNT